MAELSEEERLFYEELRRTPPIHVTFAEEVDITPTACSHVVVVGGETESGSLYGLRSHTCEPMVANAHAASSTGWETPFGLVELSPFAVTHDGEDLWSLAEACNFWIGLEQTLEECHEYVNSPSWHTHRTTIMTPRSLVGPVVSFSVFRTRHSGGTSGSHYEQGYSVDVRTGRAADYDALITTESLLAALKADPHLLRVIGPELQSAATVEAVWELWGVDQFASFGSYHFHHWSEERGAVAMRVLFLKDDHGLSPNTLHSLGLWVTPRPEFKAAFEAAARGEGGFLTER